MTPDITIKQHDTKIRFIYTPKIDKQRIPPADVAGASLSFMLRNSSVALKRVAVILDQGEYVDFIYDPISDDVAKSGLFRQEWELLTIDGKPLTFPNNGYNIVEILPDLG